MDMEMQNMEFVLLGFSLTVALIMVSLHSNKIVTKKEVGIRSGIIWGIVLWPG